MDLQLTGKRAFVSGGAGGIGLEIAKALVAEGAHVTITSRSEESLARAREALEGVAARGAKVEGATLDIGNAEGAAALIRQLPEVDILVNNLGIYEPKDFREIPDEDWQRLFEINVMSGIRLSRHYLPGMLERDHGRIIFISSESGISIPPEMVHYGMTKSAQLAISRGMAETTKGTGVTVNAVLPGPTRTDAVLTFIRKTAANPDASDSELETEFFRQHRPNSLLQRLIDPAEVGRMVAYVASPLTQATNGAALRVEGGMVRTLT